jgi:predicted metal-binding transcription factor (methanogenesis marker protein 9)
MLQMTLGMQDRTPWEVLLSKIEDAVTYLGLKEVTFRLNVAKSTLCDALKDRNDRRWAQEWTLAVLEMLADNYSETNNQFAKAILDAQAVVTRRFEVIASTDGPTDAEIAALERALADAKKRRRAA